MVTILLKREYLKTILLTNKIKIMKTIKKIAAIHMVAETRGKAMSLFMKVGLPLFVFFSFLMMLISFSEGSTSDGVIGLLGVIFFGAGGLYLFKGGNYIPQKTFFFYRLTKDGLKKYCKWGIIIAIAYGVFILIIDPLHFLKDFAGYLIPFFVAVYYLNKSIMVHEDVDYVTNTQFADLIGFEVDEKINASYQNFDASKTSSIRKDSSILLVSNRKLFFAFYDGTNWLTTIKKFEDIEKIGCMNYGDDGTNTYLKIVFADDTIIGLRLIMYNNLTSNPNLFVKRFLESIDAYLLGYSISNRNNRRRVSVDTTSQVQHDEPIQTSDTIENTKTKAPVTRRIDISESIINDIKQGVIVEPGRTIEL